MKRFRPNKSWIAPLCVLFLMGMMAKMVAENVATNKFLERADTLYLSLHSRARHDSMGDAVWHGFTRLPYTIDEDVVELAQARGLKKGYVIIGTYGGKIAWVKRLDDGEPLGEDEYLLKWRYERNGKIRLGSAWFLPRSNPGKTIRPPSYAKVKIDPEGHMMFIDVVDSSLSRSAAHYLW